MVTGDSPETLAKAKEVVVTFLKERGLELSPEKTRIVSLAEGFNFLGQNVRLYGDKVLIKPSKDEDKWAQIPWQTSLWEARREAA